MRKTLLALPLLLLAGLSGAVPAGRDPAKQDLPRRVLEHTASLDGVTVSLRMHFLNAPKAPLLIEVAFSNGSGKAIDYLPADLLVNLEVADGAGKPVRLTAAGDREMGLPVGGMENLKAGETKRARYDLTRWFVLDRPGYYTLTVLRTFSDGSDDEWGGLRLKDVGFHVGNATNPFRTDD